MRVEDVRRSLRKWLFIALDDDAWTLRDERLFVADEQRPVGYIEESTPVSTPFARASIPQGDIQRRVTITASLYPSMAGTAEECGVRARDLAELLSMSWEVGLVVPGDPDALPDPIPEVSWWPSMLPVWDFAGVGLDAKGPADTAAPLSYAEADSVTVRPIPDPVDDRRWTVVLELRLTWWAPGRSRGGSEVEPLVDEFEGTYIAP